MTISKRSPHVRLGAVGLAAASALLDVLGSLLLALPWLAVCARVLPPGPGPAPGDRSP